MQLSETATLCGATFLFKNLIQEKCFLFLVAEIPVGCSQQEKDKDIKKIITVKAKDEPAFAAVYCIGKDGVVTLTGNVLSEIEKK